MLQQTLTQLSVDSQPWFENQALLRLKSLSATHNSGLFHLANGSFGRCCRHLNKKMFKKKPKDGAQLLPGTFWWLVKRKSSNIQEETRRGNLQFLQGGIALFLLTRLRKGQRLSLALLPALI